jgi:sugar/nucleoside kinase (ribokinase family)
MMSGPFMASQKKYASKMPRGRQYDVCVAGHLCLDITPEISKKKTGDIASLVLPGKLLDVGGVVFGTGGTVSNTGITLHKLGLDVLFVAQVGNDRLGQITVDLLSRYGGTEGIRRTSATTSSYSIILAFPGVDRIVLHDPGCNDIFSAKSLDYGRAGRCQLFHFGYPILMRRIYLNNGAELKKIFRAISRLGPVTSLDTALPDPDSESGRIDWRKYFENVLPLVDIFTPSLEEALYFIDPRSYLRKKKIDPEFNHQLPFGAYRELAREFLDMGCGLVIIKAGARGIFLKSGESARLENFNRLRKNSSSRWRDRELWAPAHRIRKIVSTTGAGDACVGGFLAGVIRGYGPEEALRFAACVGAQNLRAMDTTSGIGSWKETRELLNSLPVRRLPWRKPEAIWDREGRVWRGREDRGESCGGRGRF